VPAFPSTAFEPTNVELGSTEDVVTGLFSARFADGVPMVTFNDVAALVPQVLLALTEIIPPDAPTVIVIDVLVELPDQPDGRLQVYDVAPLTAAIE
jgi:hypothetical protein